MKLRILIVAVCFIGSLFFAFYLGTLEAMEIVEPEDRVGYIIPCPNCYEDTIAQHFEDGKLMYEDCNNYNYTTEGYDE